ncbi:hypothetical protein AB0L41_24550 [Amycolatopsis mediterranei]|uniref:hypothetical protein n=1 Tax=Amycolatopsis mediterranei TaxID=33910 RepID=UPI003437880C
MPQSPDVTVDVSVPPPRERPNETAVRRAADGATLDDRPEDRRPQARECASTATSRK